MRWETLFADLESQLQAQQAAELREEIAESTRVERARQVLSERLAGYQGMAVTVRLAGRSELCGTLGPVGPDYMCLEDATQQWLIRRIAIQSIVVPAQGTGQGAEPARTRWGAVVRALLRDRNRVQVYGLDGQSLGEGTVRQAAEDFLELALHPRDEYARTRTVQGHVIIPYQGVGWMSVDSHGESTTR